MSEKKIRCCDVCGADQAATNGWYAYWIRNNILQVGHANDVRIKKVSHACGQSCVHKALDAYFTSQLSSPVIPSRTVLLDEIEPSVRTIGLTVEELVAEQGGKPEKATYVKPTTDLTCDSGEECQIIETTPETTGEMG
jgi:hypothetical protein